MLSMYVVLSIVRIFHGIHNTRRAFGKQMAINYIVYTVRYNYIYRGATDDVRRHREHAYK